MVREVITINIGKCGVQFGDCVWKQYCKEHSINKEGKLKKAVLNNKNRDNTFTSSFNQINKRCFTARTIMIDTDPTIIDIIKNSAHSKIYDVEYLISGDNVEGCSTNFAAGHYGIGKELFNNKVDHFMVEKIRKIIEQCDNCQGFIFNHSVAGGTGSGLAALMMERCAVDYRYKAKINFPIYPFDQYHPQLTNEYTMEWFNMLLSTHWMIDHCEVSYPFDNNRVYDICTNQLNIGDVSFNDMNMLMSKAHSAATHQLRYEGYADLHDYQTNLVPFPRLHFITVSMAPIVNETVNKIYIKNAVGKQLCDGFVRRYYNHNYNVDSLEYEAPLYKELMNLIYCSYSNLEALNKEYTKTYYNVNDESDLFSMCLDTEYFMNDMDFDIDEDKLMSLQINVNSTSGKSYEQHFWKQVDKEKHVFVEWVPTKPKTNIYEHRIPSLKDDIILSKDTIAMFGNYCSMSTYFENKILSKTDKMLNKKQYINLYIAQGMEQEEINEAIQDIQYLKKDYLDVLDEQATDDDDTD